MNVYFVPPLFINRSIELAQLYFDFCRETCKSFGAECFFIMRSEQHKQMINFSGAHVAEILPLDDKTIYLEATEESELISDVDFSQYENIIVGADDFDLTIPERVKRARIDTGVNYPLWSAVAAGIVLHEASRGG